MIDLHMHSTASDGLLAPAEVVRFAVEAGLTAMALTDHDSTAGLAEAHSTGAALGIRVIGGCEFSVGVDWGEMHLLGYFIPQNDAEIEKFLSNARADRVRRAREMVNKLFGLGISIQWSDVEAEAAGGAVGRPHVARALERGGHVSSVQGAFDKYLRPGRPAFVEKVLPAFKDVADLVHSRGGVVSAAHLRDRSTRANLQKLKSEGLDAVETRHPSHRSEILAQITELAIELDLARSGGSDWHGELDPKQSHAMIGAMQIPEEWLNTLEARRPAHSGGQ